MSITLEPQMFTFHLASAESVISYNTWPEADRKRPKLKVCAADCWLCMPWMAFKHGSTPYLHRVLLETTFCLVRVAPQAVAALLQQDTSAVVTLKSSGIDRPAKASFAVALLLLRCVESLSDQHTQGSRQALLSCGTR
jgi:hypothetical protein